MGQVRGWQDIIQSDCIETLSLIRQSEADSKVYLIFQEKSGCVPSKISLHLWDFFFAFFLSGRQSEADYIISPLLLQISKSENSLIKEM